MVLCRGIQHHKSNIEFQSSVLFLDTVEESAMRTLAVFRSCLRKEYRDQVIKMLRAVPGEHTRTSYRTDWISPEALELIESGENFNVVTYLVDQNLQ